MPRMIRRAAVSAGISRPGSRRVSALHRPARRDADGERDVSSSTSFGGGPSLIAVRTHIGHATETPMPFGRSAPQRPSEKPTRPKFDFAYGVQRDGAISPAADAMFTMY